LTSIEKDVIIYYSNGVFMTMHIVGPWLSTSGSKKGKVKFKSAEDAKRSRELDKSWKELLKRQGIEQEQRKRQKALEAEALVYKLSSPAGRGNTKHIPSLNTGDGIAHSKKIPQYTGTKMLGIGTMHKSNAVPIFSDDEAKEISSMRR
jgi:hypothetical protein